MYVQLRECVYTLHTLLETSQRSVCRSTPEGKKEFKEVRQNFIADNLKLQEENDVLEKRNSELEEELAKKKKGGEE